MTQELVSDLPARVAEFKEKYTPAVKAVCEELESLGNLGSPVMTEWREKPPAANILGKCHETETRHFLQMLFDMVRADRPLGVSPTEDISRLPRAMRDVHLWFTNGERGMNNGVRNRSSAELVDVLLPGAIDDLSESATRYERRVFNGEAMPEKARQHGELRQRVLKQLKKLTEDFRQEYVPLCDDLIMQQQRKAESAASQGGTRRSADLLREAREAGRNSSFGAKTHR